MFCHDNVFFIDIAIVAKNSQIFTFLCSKILFQNQANMQVYTF